MADIYCAKCSEPWDPHDIPEKTRFLAGEGCVSCAFGTRCSLCSGTGREEAFSAPDCGLCHDRGLVLAWSPSRSARGFLVGEFYTGYHPNVLHLKEGSGTACRLGVRQLPERIGTHQTADGAVTEWWVACPKGCALKRNDNPCGSCGGSGELKKREDAEMRAARSELAWSDEEPIGILIRRGLL